MLLPSLENLHCFVCAARLLNFRQAAKVVGLTPAAFGQRIQKLEEQLAVKLFERTTRSIQLTRAGLALVEPAQACLRLAEETTRAVRSDRAPTALEIVVGTRHELGMSWLLPQLTRFDKIKPWLQLHLYFGSGPDLLLRLRTMEVDCAVTSSRLGDPKLDSLRLHREDYVFCGSSALLGQNPLARAEDATRHTLLDMAADCPLFRYWKDAPEGGDRLRFRRGMWLGSIEAIRKRMLSGAGVGVLPAYLVADDLRRRRLQRVFPSVRPLHDYFRLVFRGGDPRRATFEDLAASLLEAPLS
jgi:LysR family glycine cleavage system transcriptional activator